MKLLLAEDDPLFRRLLQRTLESDYEIVTVPDGRTAWDALQAPDHPRIAALDWMMPRLDGVQLCRQVRATPAIANTYILLITGRGGAADTVVGLNAGADDYIVKPFNPDELKARVKVGERIVGLQDKLADHIVGLERALEHVKVLQGLLPICSYCKRIRDDRNYWQQLEMYLSDHSDLVFSHGICPECYEKHWKLELAQAAETKSGQ